MTSKLNLDSINQNVFMLSSNNKNNIAFIISDIDFLISHRLDLILKLSETQNISVITDVNISRHLNQQIEVKLAPIHIIHLPKRKARNIFSAIKYVINLFRIIFFNDFKKIFFVTLELSLIGAILKIAFLKTKFFFLITGFGPYLNIKNGQLSKIVKIVFFISQKIAQPTFILQNEYDQDILLSQLKLSKSNLKIIRGSGIEISSLAEKIYPQRCTFIMVGNLFNSKGVNEYLKASKQLTHKYRYHDYPPIFLLAGKYDPTNFDSISEDVYKEITSNSPVSYLGYLGRDQLFEALSKSSVFVLPSYAEGLPKAALEAGIHFLPLVLSDIPGNQACIQMNRSGYFARPKDPESLADAMDKFINNQQSISDMGKASANHMKSTFSLDKIVSHYSSLIK